MPYYSISHLTRYTYSEFITASFMEVRMRPRSDDRQTCTSFNIKLSPAARVLSYQDYLQNTIHFFDIPGAHHQLAINVESVVEVRPRPDLPEALPPLAWDALHVDRFDRDCYDMLQPGHFTTPTDLTRAFAVELGVGRRDDPLTALSALNTAIYHAMDYEQSVTTVDSPVDVALASRKGVCQDFAHIMATLVRGLEIPCRYVSGYLFHHVDNVERSAPDASHAWVEAWLPELGWVGFDPTNNVLCGDRHIRVCVGLDYADTAPTRGVFTGDAETSLEVNVRVSRLETPPAEEGPLFTFELPNYENQQRQQQQQQQ
jgi:transglutaminase-like putative cysteine protease